MPHLPKPVLLAPMAGVTDKPFRHMVRLFGNQVLFTEMMGVESFHRNHPTTRKMMSIQDEKNIVVQLVGVNKEALIEAAQAAVDNGAIGVDINMGCPVKKLITNGSGAALMRTPLLAAELTEAISSRVSVPVSVKTRLGWDNEHISIVDFAKTLESAGASRLEIHARTKEEGYAGRADWGIVQRVKESVSIPVIVNGDIVDHLSAKKALSSSQAEGVMVGRGALGRPWMLTEIETGTTPLFSKVDLVLQHLDLLLSYYGRKGLFIARKHIAWYARGQKGVAEFCQSVYADTEMISVQRKIKSFFKEDI